MMMMIIIVQMPLEQSVLHKLLKAGFNRHFLLSGETGPNGSIRPCHGPGFSSKWVHGLEQLAKCFLCGFCSISATKFFSGLHSPF